MAEKPRTPDYSRDPHIDILEGQVPDIQSRVRFEGEARNTDKVKVAIVVPSALTAPIYGSLVCEVKVFSLVARGYHFRGLFNLRGMNQRQSRQKAGILAGAMTENMLGIPKVAHDKSDPVFNANEAMRAWDNALARFEAKQHTPLPRDTSMDALLRAIEALQP